MAPREQRAEQQIDCILLDDSFQHLKVKKDAMFVVFSAGGGVGNGFVLPAGILRESLSALRFADAVVINGKGWNLPRNPGDKPVLRGDFILDHIYDANGETIDLVSLRMKKVMLLSGIGNPESFEKTVRDCGITYPDHLRFPDHYDYSRPGFLDDLKKKLSQTGCDMILTTEKDYAKLSGLDMRNVPLAVLAVRFEMADEEALWEMMRLFFGLGGSKNKSHPGGWDLSGKNLRRLFHQNHFLGSVYATCLQLVEIYAT